jgi:hypothetical protein
MASTYCISRFMQEALKLSDGEKWHATFLKALPGTVFSLGGSGQAFLGVEVQDVTVFGSV